MAKAIFKSFLLIISILFTAHVAAQYRAPIVGWPNTGSYLGYGAEFPSSYHNARDIPARVGTNVVAVLDGEVVYNQEASGFGGLNPTVNGGAIVLKHKNDQGQYFYAIYGHLNRSLRGGRGTRVRKGQILGTIREFYRNGRSLPHLHFGIYTGRTFPTSKWGYPRTLSGWTEPDAYLRDKCKGKNDRYNGYPVDVAKNLRARQHQGKVVLSWDAVRNANAYRIMVSTSNSRFSANNGLPAPTVNTTSVSNLGSSTKGYIFENGRPGQTYHFTVRYNVPGVGHSAFSTPVQFTFPRSNGTESRSNSNNSSTTNNRRGSSLPRPPTGLKAASKNGLAAIMWDQVAGASQYMIQISESSRGWSQRNGFQRAVVSTTRVSSYRSNKMYYKYTKGRKGRRYYYSIKVRGRDGRSWSSYSSPKSFTFN